MQSSYYTFTDKTIDYKGRTLHQIRATRDIDRILLRSGDVGGYIEHPENLTDLSWVTSNAKVYGDARVERQSLIAGRATVCDEANISNSIIGGASIVNKRANISSDSTVSGNAYVTDDVLISNSSHVTDYAIVAGESRVTHMSAVEGNARLEDNARVAHGSWVYGDYVLRNPSHCIMHTIDTPHLSAGFTLALEVLPAPQRRGHPWYVWVGVSKTMHVTTTDNPYINLQPKEHHHERHYNTQTGQRTCHIQPRTALHIIPLRTLQLRQQHH